MAHCRHEIAAGYAGGGSFSIGTALAPFALAFGWLEMIASLFSRDKLVISTERSDNFMSTQANVSSETDVSKKPVNLPSWKKLKVNINHISSGHLPGGPRNPIGNKTIFWGMTIEQVRRAIQEAYSNASKLATQGDRILVEGYSAEFDLIIEIWINVVENVIETAYPVRR